MTYFNEIEAVKYALSTAIRFNDCDLIVARDTLPVEKEHFKNLRIKYLSQRNCMQVIYDCIKSNQLISSLDNSVLLKIAMCNIDRMNEAALLTNTEYIFYMEPDVLVKRRINPKRGIDLECLDVNKYPSNVISFIENYSKRKMNIKGWGYCTGFALTQGFIKVKELVEKNPSLMDELINLDYRFIFADFAFPILFHLAGFKVTKTNRVTECNRNPLWFLSAKPILHQYNKKY
jgi:hypothetical protein